MPRVATVVDLGCGTGSSFRALAPHVDAAQAWRLVDHDPALIAIARRRIGAAAAVEAHPLDLRTLDALPLAGADLATASALFDLVGRDWLRGFVAALTQARVPLYAALSYDGHMHWSLSVADDAAVVAAFNRHQRGDKGLGPALGPDAAGALAEALAAAGYRVLRAPSPWRIDAAHAAMQRELLHGIATAARETGDIAEARVAGWLHARLERVGSGTCTVGHEDVLALPDRA
nr:class I SAM-dependent methyltransferase [Coralloluteibacterium stylophorae]